MALEDRAHGRVGARRISKGLRQFRSPLFREKGDRFSSEGLIRSDRRAPRLSLPPDVIDNGDHEQHEGHTAQHNGHLGQPHDHKPVFE
jgi:hypothetical protein